MLHVKGWILRQGLVPAGKNTRKNETLGMGNICLEAVQTLSAAISQ